MVLDMVKGLSNFRVFRGLNVHIVHQRVVLIASHKDLRVGLNPHLRTTKDAFNIPDLLLGAMLLDVRTIFNLIEIRQ